MQRRRVPLFEFMPYGAPELVEAFPTFLTRAVFTGALLWSAAFVLLMSSGLLRFDHPIPVSVTCCAEIVDL